MLTVKNIKSASMKAGKNRMADNRKEQERAELHRTIWSIANDLLCRNAVLEIGEYKPHDFCFLWVDDELPAVPMVTVYVERVCLVLLEALPYRPLNVFTERTAFLLREGSEDDHHQFAVAVHGVNVLFLKTNLDAQFSKPPHRFEQVDGVSGKPADGLNEDDGCFARFAVGDEPLEFAPAAARSVSPLSA